jgi:cell division cycle protein 20 (cofactor of APC complex)
MATPMQLSTVDSPMFEEPAQFATDRRAARIANAPRTPIQSRPPRTTFHSAPHTAQASSPTTDPRVRPGAGAASPAAPRSADRFVPTRAAMDFDLSYHQLTNENLATNSLLEDDYSSGVEYKSILSKMLFEGADRKILRFTTPSSPKSPCTAPHSQRALQSVAACEQAELRQIYHENQAHSPFSRMQHRQISHTPEKILDAPDLLDDYYLNLLDWSSKNVLAVALGQTVYLWNAHTGQISQLTQTSTTEDYVASLNFSADGTQIAVGTNSAQVKLFDVEKMKQIRSMKGHLQRVSSLAWNGNLLSSGSRDALIFNHDVRATTHHQGTLQGHR